MNLTVAIRPGSPRDHGFVLDLGRRISGTSVSTLRVGSARMVELSFEVLAKYVWTRDHTLLVAEEAGVPVGFALLVYDMPDEVTLEPQAFLAYMAVEPERWGRGIGRALLGACETLARERGLGYVSLMVTEENAAARALYERTGFQTERRLMTKPLQVDP